MDIDSHQHFWHYAPDTHDWITDGMEVLKQDFLPPNLAPLLKQHHLEGCVAVQASQTEQETDFLLHLASHYDFIRGVVGWVDLQDEQVAERLAHYAQFSKLVGMRHIVQSEADEHFMARPEFLRGVALLPDYGLAYDLLIVERQLPSAIQLVKHLPQIRLVLDHIAKPRIAARELGPWEENIRVLATYPNVYCKLSGMVTEADWDIWQPDDLTPYLDVVVEAFGPDRLMFGSDWPVCLLAAPYQRVYEVVDRYLANFTKEERAKIYGRNAIDFYQLST